MFWYSWSKADRVTYFIETLKRQETFTADEIWGLIRTSSLIDVNARYFMPFIEKAAQLSTDPNVKKVAEVLKHIAKDLCW